MFNLELEADKKRNRHLEEIALTLNKIHVTEMLKLTLDLAKTSYDAGGASADELEEVIEQITKALNAAASK